MATLVAIGGGEIGRPGYPLETLEIDKKIVDYSGKDRPTLCFLPTATHDSESYIQAMEQLYGEMLGCTVASLESTKRQYAHADLLDIVRQSDIIYVGGMAKVVS